MRSRSEGAEPARFETARRRFELWRRRRQGRARIPERLWASAVKLAATYGMCRTARTLRLDYNALKQRVDSAGLNDSPAGPRPKRKILTRSAPVARNPKTTRIPRLLQKNPAMTFVELTPLEHPGSPECTVELEDPRGAKMRILVAVEPADFRKGFDGLARLCKEELKRDPFCGWLFVFRNRRAAAVKVLAYDGQGFWLSHKLCRLYRPLAGPAFSAGVRVAVGQTEPSWASCVARGP